MRDQRDGAGIRTRIASRIVSSHEWWIPGRDNGCRGCEVIEMMSAGAQGQLVSEVLGSGWEGCRRMRDREKGQRDGDD